MHYTDITLRISSPMKWVIFWSGESFHNGCWEKNAFRVQKHSIKVSLPQRLSQNLYFHAVGFSLHRGNHIFPKAQFALMYFLERESIVATVGNWHYKVYHQFMIFIGRKVKFFTSRRLGHGLVSVKKVTFAFLVLRSFNRASAHLLLEGQRMSSYKNWKLPKLAV